ncbi:tetratricopeptide repeat protein [Tengunoibacter tsumagoiensis]|uniref:AAA+ ATPase domain-containing protein n=1 Tax=Tengunoibacter tsumagoiensis TaxID=2014871 RepID=A0A401ZTS7_9CHLR|nr:tetratricopeptide repeat protein [Tengunoibacter tsumagoiensis]GCE10212.1 hypothetical protein KTT_00710 [Tengunoibacter tsumagoiensis]
MQWGDVSRPQERPVSSPAHTLSAQTAQTGYSVDTNIRNQSHEQRRSTTAFGVTSLTPPPTDPQTTMQRTDEVNTIQRMLREAQTSAVFLTGHPGVGKSTLAALLYHRLLLAKKQGLAAPHHLVWLTLGTYSTLPDIIAAILSEVQMDDPGLFMLKPEQQISTLLRALRRSQEQIFVFIDQFELLLYPETNQGVAGRGVLPAFLEMLQTDLGHSRIIMTSYSSPFENQDLPENRVRSYLVSRISLPEGIALLQLRGMQGSPDEISSVWRRCMGQAYAMVLFSALLHLSGISLSYVLTSSDYQPMWAGDVTANLIGGVYSFLNPVQRAILHVLSLFHEPTPMDGIVMTITGKPKQQAYSENQAVRAFEQELHRLVNAGLIQTVLDAWGQVRFTLHPLLRQFVLEHFLEDGTKPPSSSSPDHAAQDPQKIALAAGHTQVAAYYRHAIQEFCPPRGRRKGLQDVVPIIEAIRHLCQGWRWQRACELLFTEQIHETLVQWGAWNTLIGLYTAMLPPFGVLKPHDEGLVNSQVAMLYGRIGEPQQSRLYFEQALSIQRSIPDHQGEATTLTNQGELLRIQGDLNQASTLFKQALAINDQYPDLTLRSVLLHNMGLLEQQMRRHAEALNHYIEALTLAHHLNKQPYIAMILTNMGMLLYEQKQQKEAIALLLTALQLRQTLNDPTAPMLERFLVAIEQKLGSEQYQKLCTEAMKMQPEVFARFAPLKAPM